MKKEVKVRKPQINYSKVLDCALSMVGRPYEWGGDNPLGFDCSGLISYCFTHAGFPVYHHTCEELLKQCTLVESTDNQDGDLVFRKHYSNKMDCEMVDHVGIRTTQNFSIKIISAREDQGVVQEKLTYPEYNIFARLNPNYKYPTIVDYRTATLSSFTSRPDFLDRLDIFVEEQRKVMEWECTIHRDTGNEGFIPWAVHCQRKGSRVLGHLRGKPGRDSMKHDLRDGFRYFLYANLYYDLLKEKEKDASK